MSVSCDETGPETQIGNPKNRSWRTLFHVIHIHNQELMVIVPAWNSRLAVEITWENIAPEIRHLIKVDGRYYGQARIGADDADWDRLNIWINEAAGEPDPNDGLA